MSYPEVINDLRQAYDRSAARWDRSDRQDWKVRERGEFLRYLLDERKGTLLELGAGPGRDGKFFQDNGLRVTCTDLSPEMVQRCRTKGLEAHVMDFLNLDFPKASFDAVYALNCLLHVPKADLPQVLESVAGLLKPGGLFYLGVYGGTDFEGILHGDDPEPKRFFSFYPDRQMLERVTACFELVYFRQVDTGPGEEFHFQSMILRRS